MYIFHVLFHSILKKLLELICEFDQIRYILFKS